MGLGIEQSADLASPMLTSLACGRGRAVYSDMLARRPNERARYDHRNNQ